MLDKKFFLKYGPDVVSKFRKHPFQDAKDVFDKPFNKYSTEYGENKRANTFKRQASKYATSTAPVLTSDLLRDFKMITKPNKNGFAFGTVAHGGKVLALEKMGRVITTDKRPIPKDIEKWLLRMANKYIDKNLKKIKGFNIKI